MQRSKGKRNRRSAGWSALTLALLTALTPSYAAAQDPSASVALVGVDGGTYGEFELLTYNVAGLPSFISQAQPDDSSPEISRLLQPFDIVLLQEDFWYHGDIREDAGHPFESVPVQSELRIDALGDGLNRFSRFPFADYIRTQWSECNGMTGDGWDCIASKGFTAAETQLASGVVVDVYNLHLDAGNSEGDRAVRARQVDQLLVFLAARSSDRPLVIAGDTNLSDHPTDQANLARLMTEGDLVDACEAVACETQLIDRVMYRSSVEIELVAQVFRYPPGFVDDDGQPLSDHPPVAVRFGWRQR